MSTEDQSIQNKPPTPEPEKSNGPEDSGPPMESPSKESPRTGRTHRDRGGGNEPGQTDRGNRTKRTHDRRHSPTNSTIPYRKKQTKIVQTTAVDAKIKSAKTADDMPANPYRDDRILFFLGKPKHKAPGDKNASVEEAFSRSQSQMQKDSPRKSRQKGNEVLQDIITIEPSLEASPYAADPRQVKKAKNEKNFVPVPLPCPGSLVEPFLPKKTKRKKEKQQDETKGEDLSSTGKLSINSPMFKRTRNEEEYDWRQDIRDEVWDECFERIEERIELEVVSEKKVNTVRDRYIEQEQNRLKNIQKKLEEREKKMEEAKKRRLTQTDLRKLDNDKKSSPKTKRGHNTSPRRGQVKKQEMKKEDEHHDDGDEVIIQEGEGDHVEGIEELNDDYDGDRSSQKIGP
ncbi:hypothetical protein BLNAU_18156 [Blattamonas nauphoetae]|uniref:Uncharacterized protein n=1 Tax=Blattamonas nauphoetae TaxID=2049346 RepID=A0ABQ9X7G6_9EUKA|nr:hypothetical protein BLNAU_18156 [Blattamonas nauphoetae]